MLQTRLLKTFRNFHAIPSRHLHVQSLTIETLEQGVKYFES